MRVAVFLAVALVRIPAGTALRHGDIQAGARATRWEPNASVAGNMTGFQAAFREEWQSNEAIFWNHLERCSKSEPVETWYCNLPVCKRHGDDAPLLFTTERGDGVGGRMISIILTMELADRLGWNFGGLILTKYHVSHGVNFLHILDEVFGSLDPDTNLYGIPVRTTVGFQYDHVMKQVDAFNVSSVRAGEKIVVDPFIFQYTSQTHIAEQFLAGLRTSPQVAQSSLMNRPLLFKEGRLNVAIHLRRGDIEAGNWRSTSDDFYYRQVDAIRSILPDADIHVFSALETRWKSADFDGFRKRGMQVHLDTAMGVAETWAHMARAHVLIMARSSFAYVPAYINSHCAIHLEYFFPSATSWLDGMLLGEPAYEAQLAMCIKQAFPHARKKSLLP